MKEATLEARVRKLMRPYWIDHKHRDLNAGVPDLSFTMKQLDGWIEFKWVEAPVRETTVPRVDWSAAQKLWLRKRGEAGAACYVILGVGKWVFLMGWEEALRRVNRDTLTTLQIAVLHQWAYREMTGEEIQRALWEVR